MKTDLVKMISDLVGLLPYYIEEDVMDALQTCYETLVDLEMGL